MSPTKIIGAVIGAGLGVAIASLFISAALQNVSAPARLVVAVIMLGGFLGAALGAYIGSDDRRRRTEIAPSVIRGDAGLTAPATASPPSSSS